MRTAGLSWLVLAGISVLSATTIIPVSVEQLTHESSYVVEATAQQSWAQWNPQHTLIFTYTRFQISRSLKGHAPDMVLVKQIGGSVGGYTQKVAGIRHWHPGERAVLFLQPSKSADGTLEVSGLMQGNFLIRRSGAQTLVSNGVPGVSRYVAGAEGIGVYRGTGMTLQELETRVQKVVQP
jgi:hypothetical protein